MAQHDAGWADRLRTDDPWSASLVDDPWPAPATELSMNGLPSDGSGEPWGWTRTAGCRQHPTVRKDRHGQWPCRRLALPVVGVTLVWCLLYGLAATGAPTLLTRPVLGAVNAVMAAALAQFLTTALLTWVCARHCRLQRSRAALEPQWAVVPADRTGARGAKPAAKARR